MIDIPKMEETIVVPLREPFGRVLDPMDAKFAMEGPTRRFSLASHGWQLVGGEMYEMAFYVELFYGGTV